MKNLMNILYFSQLFYPAIFGGGEYIFYQWAKEMTRKGHRVFVITQKIDNTKSYENLNGIEIFRVGSSVTLKGNLPIGVFQNLSFLIGSYFKGKYIIKKYKIDLIHSNTYIPVFSAQQCAKSSHIPHIATIHDVYYSSKNDFWKKWSHQRNTPKLFQFLGPIIEKRIFCTNVTLFHTVSEQSKNDLLSSGVKKEIIVIPNGIDTTPYHSPIKEAKNQAIFIGRLVFYKNIELILEAFVHVVKNFPDAKLIIVGDGPMKLSLIDKVLQLGIAKNVNFTGQISDIQKIELIFNSSVLLNPSLVEGFGIVVLEGFACGKPALVSNVKPLSDLVDNGIDGYALSPTDPLSWATKLEELFSDSSKIQNMGKLGKQKIESKYSISQVTANLIKMYEKVLKL